MLTNILIIDDDIFLRELIKDILIDHPVSIFEAGNGDQGLDILKEEKIHLVITDIIMPEKEGLESIIEILQNYPGIKILAISGGGSTGSEQYLDMASNLGAHATLSKPFDKNDLLGKLNELIDDRFIQN